MRVRIRGVLGLLLGMSLFSFELAGAAQGNIWQRVYQSLFGEPPVPPSAGGSRGGDVCIVSPGQWSTEHVGLWQQRPLLVWRGDVKQVSVGRDDSNRVLWQRDIVGGADKDGVTRLIYGGPGLVAGEVYRVQMVRRDNVKVISRVRVLPGAERGEIDRDWLQVQGEAWRSGVRGEALVKLRVEFLSKRGLWLDVVHEVFRSGNEAEDWRVLRRGIVEESCDRR